MTRYTFFLLAALVITSCASDDIIEDAIEDTAVATNSVHSFSEDTMENTDQHTKIILGDTLTNPYSVTNMQAAFNYYNEHLENSPFQNKIVTATHYYIKIEPTTIAELEFLDQLDESDEDDVPVLHDFPLDREVIQEGDYYVWPEHEEDLYHPAYTTIRVDYVFDQNVNYEILAELYYPTDDEFDVETVSLVFAGWDEDIIAQFDQAITIEDLPDLIVMWHEHQENGGGEGESGFGSGGNFSIGSGGQYASSFSWFSSIFGRRYWPFGNVQVENTDTSAYEPVMFAKISTGRSFWWNYTYTDFSGNFSAPKKYRGKVRIRAKWRTEVATVRKSWNEVLGLWVSDHLMTITRNHNGRIKWINFVEPQGGLGSKSGHLWVKSTAYNGYVRYWAYCVHFGINNSLFRANTWTWAEGSASSAPMLKRLQTLPLMAAYGNIGQASLWNNIISFTGAYYIGLIPTHLRPDLFFQGLGDKRELNGDGRANTAIIQQLVFHESAHYSHAIQAGAGYWGRHFAATIGNQITQGAPYSDGTDPSYQAGDRISIVEGWATLAEFKISSFYFEKAYVTSTAGGSRFELSNVTGSNTQGLENRMENFKMHLRPMSANRIDTRSWFLHGLFWDLLDDRNEIILNGTQTESALFIGDGMTRIQNINDPVDIGIPGDTNRFNLGPIYEFLDPYNHTPCEIYNHLKVLQPFQQGNLQALFLSYGFDCDNALQ